MPRAQPTALIDTLMELYFIHSPRSLSTTPGSGPFPSCLEASPVTLLRVLFMGITVLGFVSSMSPGTMRIGAYIRRPCTV